MRQERTVQASLFDVFATHEIGHELKAMSHWLDEHRDLLGLVAGDLARVGVKATGRQGLPAAAVLRCALFKQYRQLSYQELAFHLKDSASFRAFARLPLSWSPQKSVLQKTISAIRPESWEQIKRSLLSGARQAKLEDGAVVRLDSTVTSALMHEPSDSSLLWDAVRVTVNTPELAVRAAFDGLGIAYTLEPRADIFLRSGQLVQVLEESLPSGDGFFLYYPGHRQVPVALRALIDMIQTTRRTGQATRSIQNPFIEDLGLS